MIITRLIDLPCSVNGMTVKDENDDYNIYLNSRLSEDGQKKTYIHELSHIVKNHFYSLEPVKIKEKDCGKS